jgi:DNA-binding NarL/FixJ family response regulator
MSAPRVLLGNLEPFVRLGMTTVLGEGRIEVVGSEERPAALLLMAGRVRPDAVVLDLERAASRELAERVQIASPETIVVFWARGLVACLESMPEVESVAQADSISAARDDPALADADLAIIDPIFGLCSTLLRGVPNCLPDRSPMTRLNERELPVLSLIAAGHPTREVAKQLCYSERTVKNVLHDVVTKLNARSRSQAVASAVREGLI